MKLFSVVLELENEYHSGPKIGQKFTSKARITFPAADEQAADKLLLENFLCRMVPGQKYELECGGEAPPGVVGFAVSPLL